MGKVVKVKNILELWVDGKAAPYKFDINTDILYGLKGSAIKTTPAGVATLIDRNTHTEPICSYLYSTHYYSNISYAGMAQYAKELQLVDRLHSIGYFITYWDKNNMKRLVEFFDADTSIFKKFSAYYKEHTQASALRDFFAEYGRAAWIANHKLVVDEHLTAEMVDWIYNNRSYWEDKDTPLIAYYLSRGLWEFLDTRRSELPTYFRHFFAWCDAIGHTPDKSDFFRQYLAVKRTYIRNKTEYDNARFLAQQNKHRTALTFEDENFVAVIAETPQDLVTEGQAQNNCVGGYNNSVIEGRCNIVFIRRKTDPNRSYITCEIYTDGGRIGQYLTRFNDRVRDEDALAFKGKYQEHLYQYWNVGE